ncbi:hypothetical protein [Pseudonocardia spirodelae]|uniref:Uncharacterized protein n=1 Tax=Pseudonocardia spirodelae TaxID=3133431 RepID=A0ABU8TE63_9PSEU
MTAPAAPSVRGARRAMIVAVVASLVVASVSGIVALLGGGFGDTAARVVVTTLVVAAFGTTALCHLAVVTRAVRLLGIAGLAASVAAAVCVLWLIWWGEMLSAAGGDLDGTVVKAALVLTIAAVSLAHANLLLLLSGRRSAVIRAGLALTLAAIAVVAVMLALPVLTDGVVGDGEDYWRWLGVAGIVDALGTVALPVLGVVLRPRDPASGGPVRLVLDLPPELAARLDAAGDGRDRAATAVDVLRSALPG